MKKIEKLKEILKDKEFLLAIWLSISLVTHFSIYYELLFKVPNNPTYFDLLNQIICIITAGGFLLFVFEKIFYLATRDAHAVENWAIKNLTRVCYFIIIILGICFIQKYLTIDLFLTSIGATIVFWYWYKKYERDKEIELIKYYSEKYNEISLKMKTYNGVSINEISNIFSELINLWYSEYHLWKTWYVSDKLWNDWEYWIKSDIFLYICEWAFWYEWKYWWNYTIDKTKSFDIFFIRALVWLSWAFKFNKEKKYWDLSWRDFLLMLLPTINECHDLIKKNVKEEIKSTPWYTLIDWFFQAINSDLKTNQ